MCRRVFGERLGLSVLLAPLYWLSRHTLRHCGSMVDHLVHLGVERGRLFAPSGGPATDPIGERYSRLVAAGEIDTLFPYTTLF